MGFLKLLDDLNLDDLVFDNLFEDSFTKNLGLCQCSTNGHMVEHEDKYVIETKLDVLTNNDAVNVDVTEENGKNFVEIKYNWAKEDETGKRTYKYESKQQIPEDGKPESVKAKIKDGVLSVTIEKLNK